MKVLFTGGNGSLAFELSKYYKNMTIPSNDILNLSDKKSVLKFFNENDFDVIIHNESLLNIRICEEQKQDAMKINILSTKNIVDVIKEHTNTQLIHVSTPCVFDGKSGMYLESSIPYPVNFYGLTRLLAEYLVQELPIYTIIRTNYVSRKKWPYPKAFTDRFGTYLFPEGVAKGIHDVQKQNATGIIHIVGDKKLSLYELAKITTPEIEPMTLKDYSGPPLTVDMSLDTKRWKKYRLN